MVLPEIKSIERYVVNNFTKKSVTKIAVVGDNSVGKTSFLETILHENPSSYYSKTLGFNVLTKKITSDRPNENKLLTFLDFSGIKYLSDLRKACYSGIDIIIAVCDITNQESLDNIENFWIPEFMERENFDRNVKTAIQLVGTKSDLEKDKVISKSDLDKVSIRLTHKYPELISMGSSIITSAKLSFQEASNSSSVITSRYLFLT